MGNQVLLEYLDHLDHRDEQDLFPNQDFRGSQVLEARLDLWDVQVNVSEVIYTNKKYILKWHRYSFLTSGIC